MYQLEQLADRTRKAAERKGDVTTNRRKRLSQSLLPSLDSIPAERVYTPLSAMLAFGRDDVLDAFRRVAGTGAQGAALVDLGLTPEEEKTKRTGDLALPRGSTKAGALTVPRDPRHSG